MIGWWQNVLPNTNSVHFCNVFFRQRAVFPSCNNKTVLEINNPARLGSTTIIYITFVFSEYSRPLHKLVLLGARTLKDDDDDKHSIWSILVYFWLFFQQSQKKIYIIYYKSKLKHTVRVQFKRLLITKLFLCHFFCRFSAKNYFNCVKNINNTVFSSFNIIF